MGYLDKNPLAKLKKPPQTPRQTFVTAEQWELVLSLIADADPFKDFLRFMLLTGCPRRRNSRNERPGRSDM
jgi:hypothetical protein